MRIIGAFAIVGLVCLAGCVTSGSRYDLVMSNSSTNGVRDVSVELGGLRAGLVPSIDAKADVCVAGMKAPLGGNARLSWRTGDGAVIQRELVIDSKQVRDFRGRVVLEIYDGGAAKLFLVPESGGPGATLPWSMPASWEGVVSIPGLSEQ